MILRSVYLRRVAIGVAIAGMASAPFLHAQKTFVAVGAKGGILRSTDGVEWSAEAKDKGPDELYTITWDGTHFHAVGNTNSARSTDGQNWEFDRLSHRSHDLAAGRDLLLSVGRPRRGAQNLQRSEDGGRNWETIALPGNFKPEVPVRSIAYGNERFVVVADDGAAAVTLDGKEWVGSRPSQTEPVHRAEVLFGGDRFLLIAGDSHAISRDGLEWQPVTLDPEATVRGQLPKVWTGEYFLILHPRRKVVYRSQDGIAWQKSAATGVLPKLGNITFANGLFVGIGYGDRLVASQNGLEWQVVRERENAADLSQQLQEVTAGEAAAPEPKN